MRPRARTGLTALAIAQIVAWGVLYYAVLVAAPVIAADTGWDEQSVFLAVTAGLLTSALCAIPVGRWLDRRPRRVMVGGAILAATAVGGAAASPGIWAFAAAWIVCGAAQSAVLYQAAFTVLTHRHRDSRRGPLTLVTLAGGLASTIFAPITAWLLDLTGWRTSFIILAGVFAAVVIPAYALTVERTWTHLERQNLDDAGEPAAMRTARFRVLTASLALMSFALYAVTLSAVPSSVEKGLDLHAASWVLGLIGAGQVIGRLLYLATPRRAASWVAPAAVGLLGSAVLAGYALSMHPIWIFVTAITAGAIRGSLTLVQASAIADRWGSRSYGRLNGALAAPVAALTAIAPGAAAWLAFALGSYTAMGCVMAAVCAAGGLLVIRR